VPAVTEWEVRFSERPDARSDYVDRATLVLAAGETIVEVPLGDNLFRVNVLGRGRGGRLQRAHSSRGSRAMGGASAGSGGRAPPERELLRYRLARTWCYGGLELADKNESEMKLVRLPVEAIRLDANNPRLPEFVDTQSETSILEYLYRTAVLDELANSFADNGYFEHEPLLVTKDSTGWVVLEGNRRLAALKVLLQSPEAAEAGVQFDIDLDSVQRDRLEQIPAYIVAGRDEVRKYLGFRHIGGIKTWSPEAKARYVVEEVDRAAGDGEDRPFLAVARRVGSNTQSIRNSYVALALLRHARSEFGLNVDHVQYERFGVWLRTINAPDMRAYIHFESPATYDEVHQAFRHVEGGALAEVLGDLSPQPTQSRPVLADSRDATAYAKVLMNERAHSVLRKYGDLSLAKQVVEQAELPLRISQLRDRATILLDELQKLETIEPEVTAVVAELARVVRAMQQLARPLTDDDVV
jgi:hypothetical protein